MGWEKITPLRSTEQNREAKIFNLSHACYMHVTDYPMKISCTVPRMRAQMQHLQNAPTCFATFVSYMLKMLMKFITLGPDLGTAFMHVTDTQ